MEPVIRIGRSSDNDVILYSAVVSRHHVEIYRTRDGWEIKSLGTNGTYLEGKRITQVPVEDGIVIRLARSGPNIQIRTSPEQSSALKALLNRPRSQPPEADPDIHLSIPTEVPKHILEEAEPDSDAVPDDDTDHPH
nr:FHA domain-containing protein [Halomicronema hongdechloris]